MRIKERKTRIGRLSCLKERQRSRGYSWRGAKGREDRAPPPSWQVQTREVGDNHRRILDRGNDLERAAAVWTVLDVNGEHAFEQARPTHACRGGARMIGAGVRVTQAEAVRLGTQPGRSGFGSSRRSLR